MNKELRAVGYMMLGLALSASCKIRQTLNETKEVASYQPLERGVGVQHRSSSLFDDAKSYEIGH